MVMPDDSEKERITFAALFKLLEPVLVQQERDHIENTAV